MNEHELMAAIAAIRAGANGAAPAGPAGMTPEVEPGIILPKDINQAIRVLIACFDADDLTLLSNDLAVVVQVLNCCGRGRPVSPAPVPPPDPTPRARMRDPIRTRTRVPPQDPGAEGDREATLVELAERIRRTIADFRDRKNPAEVRVRLRVEIGKALLEAKALLRCKGWKRWYTERCQIGRSTMITFCHAAQHAAARGEDREVPEDDPVRVDSEPDL